jgi:hypothetical protein
MTMEHEILVETIINPTTKKIDLLAIIKEQSDKVADLTRKEKPTKAAKQYQEEEEQKLIFLQDIIKRAVRTAYLNDDDVGEVFTHTDYFGTMMRYFDVEVIVRQKQQK